MSSLLIRTDELCKIKSGSERTSFWLRFLALRHLVLVERQLIICQIKRDKTFHLRNSKKLHVEIQGDNINISADKDKMNQVVINLLNNAIKFTQKEGTIKFSISKNKDHVLLIVEDNGIGIEKDQQLHIFDRFYMADPSRSRALGGQGIGLAIVKSVIEAHKGSITVKSKLGLGTKFVIKLPFQ